MADFIRLCHKDIMHMGFLLHYTNISIKIVVHKAIAPTSVKLDLDFSVHGTFSSSAFIYDMGISLAVAIGKMD